MNVSRIERWQCDLCTRIYDTRNEAEQCAARGDGAPKFQVGDIVLGKSGFGWFDGDKRWIENFDRLGGDARSGKCPRGNGNCFSSCCTFQFYYVVTFVDFDDYPAPCDRHRPRYHLVTGAMMRGYRVGYTFDTGHITPHRVKNPPAFVVQDSRRFLGQKAEALL